MMASGGRQSPDADSLNVGIAASVMLYELLRHSPTAQMKSRPRK